MITGFKEIVETYNKKGMVVAEIGVWVGYTTEYVAPLVKEYNGKYIAIDWFNGNHGANFPVYSQENSQTMYNEFMNRITNAGCSDFVEIIKMSTDDACLQIPDNSLDICFIDADHRYSNVKKDILNFLPKIKNGGIICGHDADQPFIDKFGTFSQDELETDCLIINNLACHAGVIQAIGEIFGYENISLYSHTVWGVKVIDKKFTKI